MTLMENFVKFLNDQIVKDVDYFEDGFFNENGRWKVTDRHITWFNNGRLHMIGHRPDHDKCYYSVYTTKNKFRYKDNKRNLYIKMTINESVELMFRKYKAYFEEKIGSEYEHYYDDVTIDDHEVTPGDEYDY